MGKIQIISSFLVTFSLDGILDLIVFFPNTLKVLSLFCRFHRFWKQVSWNYSLLFLSAEIAFKKFCLPFLFFLPIFRLAVVWIWYVQAWGFFLFFLYISLDWTHPTWCSLSSLKLWFNIYINLENSQVVTFKISSIVFDLCSLS